MYGDRIEPAKPFGGPGISQVLDDTGIVADRREGVDLLHLGRQIPYPVAELPLQDRDVVDTCVQLVADGEVSKPNTMPAACSAAALIVGPSWQVNVACANA